MKTSESEIKALSTLEKVNFGYPIKSIPIPSERTYLLELMEKVEMGITRMRQKAIHFNNNNTIDNYEEENTEWYGLAFFLP